jgi:metal-sulfur cluster biosynthetic enzyme
VRIDEQLRERLDQVLDPELGASIVELGMVGAISVDEAGRALSPSTRSRRSSS